MPRHKLYAEEVNHSPDSARRRQLEEWLAHGDARRWRQAAEHTYNHAARRCGVDTRTLARWEAGQTRPNSGNWRRVHRYYNSIKTDEITMAKEEPCPPPRNRGSADPAPATVGRTAEPASTT
jgi:hypothetical protein